MNSPSSLGIVFIAIAVVFVGVAFRDYLKTEGKLTIARKIRIGMAFIFAGGVRYGTSYNKYKAILVLPAFASVFFCSWSALCDGPPSESPSTNYKGG